MVLGQILDGCAECLMISNDSEQLARGASEREGAGMLNNEVSAAERIRRVSGGYVD